MAFTATIQTVEQAGASIGVTVLYADSASGWQTTHHFDFSDPSTLTAASLLAAVTEQGQTYKTSNTKTAALIAQIGATITI